MVLLGEIIEGCRLQVREARIRRWTRPTLELMARWGSLVGENLP